MCFGKPQLPRPGLSGNNAFTITDRTYYAARICVGNSLITSIIIDILWSDSESSVGGHARIGALDAPSDLHQPRTFGPILRIRRSDRITAGVSVNNGYRRRPHPGANNSLRH